nr:hypothetical protein CFP56_73353 [Quercus suber]
MESGATAFQIVRKTGGTFLVSSCCRKDLCRPWVGSAPEVYKWMGVFFGDQKRGLRAVSSSAGFWYYFQTRFLIHRARREGIMNPEFSFFLSKLSFDCDFCLFFVVVMLLQADACLLEGVCASHGRWLLGRSTASFCRFRPLRSMGLQWVVMSWQQSVSADAPLLTTCARRHSGSNDVGGSRQLCTSLASRDDKLRHWHRQGDITGMRKVNGRY